MRESVLEVDRLEKRFGDLTAVDRISFSVERGKILGLLGPNGAGKTTTIQMLMGVTSATSGRVAYFGMDFFRNKKACLGRINATSAYSDLQQRITVWENLRVFGLLYGIKDVRKRVDELSEFLDVKELFDVKTLHLSAGQRTRVHLVKALLNRPELVLMDEPTASLDPDIRDRTMSLIEHFRSLDGMSILYTSHNMDEVMRLCDEVIFLDHGRIVRRGVPNELVNEHAETALVITYSGATRADVTSALAGAGKSFSFERDNRVVVEVQPAFVSGVLAAVEHAHGLVVDDIEVRKAGLEDIFLDLARRTNVVAS